MQSPKSTPTSYPVRSADTLGRADLTAADVRAVLDSIQNAGGFLPPASGSPAHGEYREYLKSPLWRQIKRRVLRRDGWTCQYCGGSATVVHHRSYAVPVLEGRDDGLLTSLCKGCHEVLHFDEAGVERPLEEVDRLFLAKNPPTAIPVPKVDLRRRFDRPDQWSRMTDLQRRAWRARHAVLVQERRAELEAKKRARRGV